MFRKVDFHFVRAHTFLLGNAFVDVSVEYPYRSGSFACVCCFCGLIFSWKEVGSLVHYVFTCINDILQLHSLSLVTHYVDGVYHLFIVEVKPALSALYLLSTGKYLDM